MRTHREKALADLAQRRVDWRNDGRDRDAGDLVAGDAALLEEAAQEHAELVERAGLRCGDAPGGECSSGEVAQWNVCFRGTR